MMPTPVKAGLREAVFAEEADNEPHTIRAHSDCITIHLEGGGVIVLRPRHIDAISAMYRDWWDRYWAAVHEQEA